MPALFTSASSRSLWRENSSAARWMLSAFEMSIWRKMNLLSSCSPAFLI
jgi:hypothetical protein